MTVGVVRAAVLTLVLGSACLAVACHHDSLPELGTAPSLGLTDQGGHPFTSEALRGKVWIVDFMFTSCQSQCPVLTDDMAKLQRRLRRYGSALQLVSVTVDPHVDTPDVLTTYAEQHHADLGNWHFLTGKADDIVRVETDGFKLARGRRTPRDDAAGYDITHSHYLVLVDKRGTIRGYYPDEGDGPVRLRRDATRLLDGDEDE